MANIQIRHNTKSFSQILVSIMAIGIFIVPLFTISFVLAQAGIYSWDVGSSNTNSNVKGSDLIPSNNTDFSFLIQVPSVKRIPDPEKAGKYLDSYYPNKVGIPSGISNPNLKSNSQSAISLVKTSSCNLDTQCSVLVNPKIGDLASLNILQKGATTGSAPYLKYDSSTNNYYFTNLSVADNNKNIIFELCYNQGRSILGTPGLSSIGIFPPNLSDGKIRICNKPMGNGNFSSDSTAMLNQFKEDISANPLQCQLNNFSNTDLFGNPVNGVQTALGCLPSDPSGLFTVILRISIGISSAVLVILIFANAINIVTNGSNPEKLKASVANITRAIQALLLILFSVLILSIIGLQLIPFASLGAGGFLRIFGG